MGLATAAPGRTKAAGATHNVARAERVGSVAIGAALVTYGLRRRDPAGAVAALIGSAFVVRGATGHCPVYRAMGVSTGSADAVLLPPRPDVTSRAAIVNARRAVKVERAVTIEADRHSLYEFWRNFENLPRFMKHLVAVRVVSPTRSHWVAKGPAGTRVEWDAEIINDIPDSLIAWRSLPGADVPNAGSVHFTVVPGLRGTLVWVVMNVEPPAGKLGVAIAKLFGEDPDHEVMDDLRRLKRLMERGEITA